MKNTWTCGGELTIYFHPPTRGPEDKKEKKKTKQARLKKENNEEGVHLIFLNASANIVPGKSKGLLQTQNTNTSATPMVPPPSQNASRAREQHSNTCPAVYPTGATCGRRQRKRVFSAGESSHSVGVTLFLRAKRFLGPRPVELIKCAENCRLV